MTVSSDAFLDTDDLDALVERVLAEGERRTLLGGLDCPLAEAEPGRSIGDDRVVRTLRRDWRALVAAGARDLPTVSLRGQRSHPRPGIRGTYRETRMDRGDSRACLSRSHQSPDLGLLGSVGARAVRADGPR